MDKYIPLIGRVFLALIFIAAGAGKLADGGMGTIPYMESMSVPGFLFWPAAIFEVVAGLAVLVGYKTKIFAFLLAGFCALSALLFHMQPADQIQMALFMKNFAMAGGFLLLMHHGAGGMSLDAKMAASE
jgi:putative oxidoreductase